MKFSTTEDIEAPIGDVFSVLSEFESFERAAIRRGADVQRLGAIEPAAAGMEWQVGFEYRSVHRDLTVVVEEYEPDSRISVAGKGSGLTGGLEVELIALSPRRTRMSVGLTLKPKTLPARLLVQSLKLAKSKLNDRYKLRVAEFAAMTEERLGRAA